MIRFLILALALTSPAVAQVLELQAGDSSLLNAAGGRVLAYLPNETVTVSAGVLNGQVVYGASVETLFRGWDVKAGDNPLGISIPGAGLYAPIRGLTGTRATKRYVVTIFSGATGDYFSPGFLQSMKARHFGAGAFVQRKFDSANLYALGSTEGSLRTALAGADWRSRKLAVNGASGLLENRQFVFGQAAFQPFSWTLLSAAHQTYIGTTRTTVDSLGASANFGPLSAHAMFMDSNITQGESYGVYVRAGVFQLGANRYQSKFGAMNSATVSEQVRPRLRLTESATVQNGRVNYSGGLAYFSNRFTVDVSPQVYYMPTYAGRSPFQKALAVNITVPLPHGSMFHALTSVDPNGRIKFTADGSTYQQGPMAGGGPAAHYSGGKHEIRGTVVDADGKPVEGAAVRVGRDIVYTDSNGTFLAREARAKAQPVSVVAEEFASPGNWTCVSCPASASPDSEVKIVVRRK